MLREFQRNQRKTRKVMQTAEEKNKAITKLLSKPGEGFDDEALLKELEAMMKKDGQRSKTRRRRKTKKQRKKKRKKTRRKKKRKGRKTRRK
jgi:hypothetical protein